MRRVLSGRYQLDVSLSAGGQGQVFRGQDLVTKATVAIKLLEEGSSPEAVARFQQEGRLAARIRDPHLIRALHFGVSEGQDFIVFDYIPRVVPLSAMFDHGRIEPARVCDVALQVLDALTSLHEAGVVHQDVSPANILWRERGMGRIEVFLVDLGSARARSLITGAPRGPDGPVGTASYMAPEMLFEEGWDHRADLWSVGALMHVLLTGCEVDVGEPDQPLGIPPPQLLVPSVPTAISDVVTRALADAERRYPSATAMAEAIHAALSVAQALPKPQRSAGVPRWMALGGMALTALVAVIGQQALGMRSAPVERATDRPVLAVELPERPAAESTPAPTDGPAPAAKPDRPAAESTPAPTDGPAPVPHAADRTVPTDARAATVDPTTESTRTPAPASAVTPVRKARRVTWAAVEKAIKAKAADLRKCSVDDHISLGLKVSGGRAELKSVNGTTVPMTADPRPGDPDAAEPVPIRSNHLCAFEVVTSLRFADGELVGVVGVPLD